MKKFILTFLLLFYIFTNAFSQWIKTSTPPNSGGPIAVCNSKIIVISNGIYYSTNNGNNWVLSNMQNFNATGIAVMGNNVLAGNSNGVFLSTNSGINWTLTPQNTFPVNYLSSNSTYLFAGSSSGVYRSTNNGVNWNPTSVTYSVYALNCSGNNVLVSVIDNVLYTPLIYRSTSGGTSWTNFYSGLPDDMARTFAFSSQYYFAGFNGSSNGVYKSSDFGDHWFSSNLNYFTNCFEVTGAYIFAGTTAGVFLSTNNGANWNAINQGFTGQLVISKLLIANNFIFASATDGVWRRPIIDFIIDNVNSNSQVINKYSLYQNYPNPFNPITRINFDIPRHGGSATSFVSLKVFDILGREVQTLVNEEKAAGSYSVDFNASDFTSGVYFYRLNAGEFTKTKKMLLIK